MTIIPKRDLKMKMKLGVTPISNFFLIFWAPILGPTASMIYLQILRLAGRDNRIVTISLRKLMRYVGPMDNRTCKAHLGTLAAYGFIIYKSNNKQRYDHRLEILIEDYPMYLNVDDVVKLPKALQKKYNTFIAMSDLTLHDFLNIE